MNEKYFINELDTVIALNEAYANVSNDDVSTLNDISNKLDTFNGKDESKYQAAREEAREYVKTHKQLSTGYGNSFQVSMPDDYRLDSELSVTTMDKDSTIKEFLKEVKSVLDTGHKLRAGLYDVEVESDSSSYSVDDKDVTLSKELGILTPPTKSVMDLVGVATTRSKTYKDVAISNALCLLEDVDGIELKSTDIYIPYFCRVFPIAKRLIGED